MKLRTRIRYTDSQKAVMPSVEAGVRSLCLEFRRGQAAD